MLLGESKIVGDLIQMVQTEDLVLQQHALRALTELSKEGSPVPIYLFASILLLLLLCALFIRYRVEPATADRAERAGCNREVRDLQAEAAAALLRAAFLLPRPQWHPPLGYLIHHEYGAFAYSYCYFIGHSLMAAEHMREAVERGRVIELLCGMLEVLEDPETLGLVASSLGAIANAGTSLSLFYAHYLLTRSTIDTLTQGSHRKWPNAA